MKTTILASVLLCIAAVQTAFGADGSARALGFSELPAEKRSAITARVAPPPIGQREAPYSTPMYYLLAKGYHDGIHNELLLDRNRPDWQERLIEEWAELGLTSTHFLTTPGHWDDPDSVQAIRDFVALSHKHGLKVGIRLGGDENFQGIEGSGWALHPKNPENRIEEYVVWSAKVAEALKGQIEYYIIGDEVNSNSWEEPTEGGGTIQGVKAPEENRWTAKVYMEVFNKIAKAVKAADPETRLCMFGMGGLDWDYVQSLIDLGYADVAGAVAANTFDGDSREEVLDFVAKVRAIAPDFKLYSNGVGYIRGTTDYPFPTNAKGYKVHSDEAQAVRIVQGMLSLYDAGWDRTPYYIIVRQWNLPDGQIAPHWYGFFGFSDLIVDQYDNLTFKRYPAWYAFQTVAHVFYDRAATKDSPFKVELSSPVDHTLNYVRNDYENLIVLWNNDPAKSVETTIKIPTAKFSYPVKVSLFNYRETTDLPYRIEEGSVVIDKLTVGDAPVIIRLVAEEQQNAQ